MDLRRNMIHAITGLSMGIALLGCEKNKGEVDFTPKKDSSSQAVANGNRISEGSAKGDSGDALSSSGKVTLTFDVTLVGATTSFADGDIEAKGINCIPSADWTGTFKLSAPGSSQGTATFVGQMTEGPLSCTLLTLVVKGSQNLDAQLMLDETVKFDILREASFGKAVTVAVEKQVAPQVNGGFTTPSTTLGTNTPAIETVNTGGAGSTSFKKVSARATNDTSYCPSGKTLAMGYACKKAAAEGEVTR